MIEAAEENSVYLMTAYRLHSEPGTVEALERIRSHRLLYCYLNVPGV